jgi:hypothetical protein
MGIKNEYEIVFHGITKFYGENKRDAISNFLSQSETASDDFIIDKVIGMKARDP